MPVVVASGCRGGHTGLGVGTGQNRCLGAVWQGTLFEIEPAGLAV